MKVYSVTHVLRDNSEHLQASTLRSMWARQEAAKHFTECCGVYSESELIRHRALQNIIRGVVYTYQVRRGVSPRRTLLPPPQLRPVSWAYQPSESFEGFSLSGGINQSGTRHYAWCSWPFGRYPRALTDPHLPIREGILGSYTLGSWNVSGPR